MPEHFLAILKSSEQPDGEGLLLEPDRNPIAKAYHTGLYNACIPVLILGSENIFSDYERLSKLNVVFRGKPENDE